VSSHAPISIASKKLRATVNPRVGGTITHIKQLDSGLSVLGKVPWDAIEAPIGGLAARDETHWLTRYTGGWPLLFPNGGNACTVDGVFHGFHGEASIAPWAFSASANVLRLSRRFFTVPVEMLREIAVEGDQLIVREELRMHGSRPIDVMWGHHPTFGSDLLAGPVEITASANRVTVDDSYDPAANPLMPGAAGDWPILAGKHGCVDLSHPPKTMAALAYLHDLDAAWVAVRRLDNAIAAALSWDAKQFPCAWLWFELAATAEAPWHGRTRLIGIEPNTTRPALGIAEAKARGGALLRLHPGSTLHTTLRLHVFQPTGPIAALDSGGRAKRADQDRGLHEHRNR
jgi:hypothetical protein